MVTWTDLYLHQTVASGTLDRPHMVDLDYVDELGCERVVQMMVDAFDVSHEAHHVRHLRLVGSRNSSVDFVLDPCIRPDTLFIIVIVTTSVRFVKKSVGWGSRRRGVGCGLGRGLMGYAPSPEIFIFHFKIVHSAGSTVLFAIKCTITFVRHHAFS